MRTREHARERRSTQAGVNRESSSNGSTRASSRASRRPASCFTNASNTRIAIVKKASRRAPRRRAKVQPCSQEQPPRDLEAVHRRQSISARAAALPKGGRRRTCSRYVAVVLIGHLSDTDEALHAALSSSPEGSLPRGPRRIRTRRFPPSGSSAVVTRG